MHLPPPLPTHTGTMTASPARQHYGGLSQSARPWTRAAQDPGPVRHRDGHAGLQPPACLRPNPPLSPPSLGMGKIGLRAGGGGGGHSCRRKEGGGSGKWTPVTGRSKEASLKALMMTHHVRHEDFFFLPRNLPYDTYLKMISASWGSF